MPIVLPYGSSLRYVKETKRERESSRTGVGIVGERQEVEGPHHRILFPPSRSPLARGAKAYVPNVGVSFPSPPCDRGLAREIVGPRASAPPARRPRRTWDGRRRRPIQQLHHQCQRPRSPPPPSLCAPHRLHTGAGSESGSWICKVILFLDPTIHAPPRRIPAHAGVHRTVLPVDPRVFLPVLTTLTLSPLPPGSLWEGTSGSEWGSETHMGPLSHALAEVVVAETVEVDTEVSGRAKRPLTGERRFTLPLPLPIWCVIVVLVAGVVGAETGTGRPHSPRQAPVNVMYQAAGTGCPSPAPAPSSIPAGARRRPRTARIHGTAVRTPAPSLHGRPQRLEVVLAMRTVVLADPRVFDLIIPLLRLSVPTPTSEGGRGGEWGSGTRIGSSARSPMWYSGDGGGGHRGERERPLTGERRFTLPLPPALWCVVVVFVAGVVGAEPETERVTPGGRVLRSRSRWKSLQEGKRVEVDEGGTVEEEDAPLRRRGAVVRARVTADGVISRGEVRVCADYEGLLGWCGCRRRVGVYVIDGEAKVQEGVVRRGRAGGSRPCATRRRDTSTVTREVASYTLSVRRISQKNRKWRF
ncbi:hypothetical protein DFH06DRAFT_1136225 [Mycena polygramma]|nr:hypothetical protein DFH06DRAFT_1136225 [Mycena polygramma]